MGCGGSGSDPGLRWSRLAEDGRLAPARRSTALPGLDYAQCASVGGTSTRRPHASSQGRSPSSSSRPGCGPGWRQLGTRHRTPVTLLLGPVLPDSHINLISESRVWPGGGGGGSWKRDTGRRSGSGSGQHSRSPYLNLISESSDPRCGPGWRQRGKRHRTPAWLQLGSASARLEQAPPVRRAPRRPRRSGERSALPRSG